MSQPTDTDTTTETTTTTEVVTETSSTPMGPITLGAGPDSAVCAG